MEKNIQQRFTERLDQKTTLYEAFERHFAPLSRKTDDETRQQINAICDFLILEQNKAYNQKIAFEAQLGDPKYLFDGQLSGTIVRGIEKKFIRKIENLIQKRKDLAEEECKNPNSINLNLTKEINQEIQNLNEKIILKNIMKFFAWSNIHNSITDKDSNIFNSGEEIFSISSGLHSETLSLLNGRSKNLDKTHATQYHSIIEKILKQKINILSELEKYLKSNERSLSNYAIAEVNFKAIMAKLEDNNKKTKDFKAPTFNSGVFKREHMPAWIEWLGGSKVKVIKGKVDQYYKKLQASLFALEEENFFSLLKIGFANDEYNNLNVSMISNNLIENNFVSDELNQTTKIMQEHKYWNVGLAQIQAELFKSYESKDEKRIETLKIL
ncbi:MAG: hypothetical protein ACRYGR_07545 [Janthinobacterium lividum]